MENQGSIPSTTTPEIGVGENQQNQTLRAYARGRRNQGRASLIRQLETPEPPHAPEDARRAILARIRWWNYLTSYRKYLMYGVTKEQRIYLFKDKQTVHVLHCPHVSSSCFHGKLVFLGRVTFLSGTINKGTASSTSHNSESSPVITPEPHSETSTVKRLAERQRERARERTWLTEFPGHNLLLLLHLKPNLSHPNYIKNTPI